MRWILFLLVLTLSVISLKAQEEADGRWFIESFIVNGVETEFGSFSTAQLGVFTGSDDEGSASGSDGSCISFRTDIIVTSDTFIFSDVNIFENDCISSEEIAFRDAYYEFLFGDLNSPLHFVVTGEGEAAQLLLTNENGDQAVFGNSDPQIPEALVQEPWFLEGMEIDGEILEYPPYEEVREGLHIVSYFDDFGELSQGFICQAGGGATFSVYEDGNDQVIDVSGMTLLAQDCGPSMALTFDNTFINQIENKTHTYEIIEEGQGRRLILTDENGDRIFYTNDFLAPKDTMLDETWYFDSLILDDLLVVSPENTLPYLTIDSESEVWQDRAACNEYNAHYSTTQRTLKLQNYEITDAICSTDEEIAFENFYLDQFVGVNQEFSEYDYDIDVTDEGERRLTLTNLTTGDVVEYSSYHPNTAQELSLVWELTSIENEGQMIEIPDSAFATFTVEIQPEVSNYFMEDNCAIYGGVMIISENTIRVQEFNEALDDCMGGSDEPEVPGDALRNFYSVSEDDIFTYEITDGENIVTRELMITKENGDQAVYQAPFSEVLEQLTQEPWYLEYYEINGSTFNYPPRDDLQYEDFNITTFNAQGDIQQQFICWNSTMSTYDVIETGDLPKIAINDLNVMTPNCGASTPVNFDNVFIGQFRNKTHSIEISEEGQGRRLTLTGDSGDRIFYTNAFLSTDDVDANASISIYPNPASETLFVNIENQFSPESIAIYNVQGQQVMQSAFSDQIDISKLAGGLYFIKFSNETKSSVHRFIKK